MYQTLVQLTHLAFVALGLLAVACVLTYVTDLLMWAAGRPPYFKIDEAVFYLIIYPEVGFMVLDGFFTTQIAKLKYIEQLQERSSEQADASHG
jgi:hypothetical protein